MSATMPGQGFARPVPDAQQTFRAVLTALARPTLPQSVPAATEGSLATPAPLSPTLGALLLTFADDQSPLWLSAGLSAGLRGDTVTSWVRFHTGARIVPDPADALFVVVGPGDDVPPLAALQTGSDEEPHRSATLLVDTADRGAAGPLTARGPGIDGEACWDGTGLPAQTLAEWDANRALFPRGVDIVLAGRGSVRALPRTTELTRDTPLTRDTELARTTEPRGEPVHANASDTTTGGA